MVQRAQWLIRPCLSSTPQFSSAYCTCVRDRFSDFDGSNRHTVLDGSVPHVFSLAVFEDFMYWTDWNHMAVEKANRFTGAGRTILVNVTHRPMTLRVVHPLRQRQSKMCAVTISLTTTTTGWRRINRTIQPFNRVCEKFAENNTVNSCSA